MCGVPAVPLRDLGPDIELLLDGLDEVRTKSSRRLLLDDAIDLARSFTRVVVTARSHLVDELLERHEDKLTIRHVAEPRWRQIKTYVHAFFKLRSEGRPGVDGLRREEDVLRHLRERSDLGALARSPLLLTFLVTLRDLGHSLPDQRTQLYHDLAELLMSRWRSRRTMGSNLGRRFSRAEALRVLAPLGWWLVARGGGAVGEQELLGELARIEGAREPDHQAALEVAEARMEQLKSDTALLRHDGRWSFLHPTMAEYFAALEVSRSTERLATLCESPFDASLREVVVFALGHLTDIEPRDAEARRLMGSLYARSKRRGRYDAKVPTLLAAVISEVQGLPKTFLEKYSDRVLSILLLNKLSWWAAREAEASLPLLLDRAMRDSTARPTLQRVLARWFAIPKASYQWNHFVRRELKSVRVGAAHNWIEFNRSLILLNLSSSLSSLDISPIPLLKELLNTDQKLIRVSIWIQWVLDADGDARERRTRVARHREATLNGDCERRCGTDRVAKAEDRVGGDWSEWFFAMGIGSA